MAKIRAVDPDVIERTSQQILDQICPNGSQKRRAELVDLACGCLDAAAKLLYVADGNSEALYRNMARALNEAMNRELIATVAQN